MKGAIKARHVPARILVTGGTGFLGTHLVARLVEEGHHVRLISRSEPTQAALKAPALQAAFAHDGASPVAMSTAEFGKYIGMEIVKWGRVVKQGKITAK